MAPKVPIYMDNQATTAVDPRVLEAMLPYFTEKFGNAASRNHEFGWKAEEAVENARGQIARLIHASPREIVFTSGATESDNLAIKGVAEANAQRATTSSRRSPSTRPSSIPASASKKRAARSPTFRSQRGLIDLDELRRAITPKTILISIMHANNEIGVVQPIAEIGKIAKEKGLMFHVDAAQSVGKIPSTSKNSASTCFPFQRTRSTVPRASARFTSAAKIREWNSPPSSTAAARARHALRHPECSRHRRPRQSVRNLREGNG